MNKQGPQGISWTNFTWNPVTGCWGPGGTAEKPKRCFYCYAQAGYGRFGRNFEPTFHPSRLEQPLAVKKPSKIFVCSTADLFGDWVPREWIQSVLQIAYEAPQHTFQFLTKNPARLAEFNPWPKNAWVGATATDASTLNSACIHLFDVHAEVKWVSIEPLMDWKPLLSVISFPSHISWVVIGALTGRHAKAHPCRREWVEDIEQAAARAGIPVWEKDSLTIWNAPVMGRLLRKEWPR